MVEAPNVIAEGTRAGEKLATLLASFPAEIVQEKFCQILSQACVPATATWTPEEISAVTALSRAVEIEPPKDIVATEGRPLDRA